MLLVVDAGNTNITLGVFEKEELKGRFRITTKIPRTSDEYGILLIDLLRSIGVAKERIKGVITSSVVPKIMYSFNSGVIKYFGIQPMTVGTGTKTGIKVAAPNPREIGADRIVDAMAGLSLYGGPVIVVDFGTATTYDLVSEDGTFLAGVTSPGIRIAADALCSDTAKLPEVEIVKPQSILAKDTVTSIQAGLVYGCIGQTEYIIRKMKEESGLHQAKVVATGGFGKLISSETKEIHIVNPNLTLHGLRLVYERKAEKRAQKQGKTGT